MGSDELLKGNERWCFWLSEQDYINLKDIPYFSKRFDMCRSMREQSKKNPTQKLAETPYRFGEVRYKETDSIIIPIHSSENRLYIPIGFVDKDTVISNAAFGVYNAELWLFSMLSSRIHNIWVHAVGGTLETRIRYSTTLCYNTFPFPKINEEQKQRLSALAENILLTRENHTEMTLGEMYNPESMPQDLKYAHQAMDIALEQCYRPEPFTSDEERLEYLFKLYEKMTKKK